MKPAPGLGDVLRGWLSVALLVVALLLGLAEMAIAWAGERVMHWSRVVAPPRG